jgi:hypothetical protein
MRRRRGAKRVLLVNVQAPFPISASERWGFGRGWHMAKKKGVASDVGLYGRGGSQSKFNGEIVKRDREKRDRKRR